MVIARWFVTDTQQAHNYQVAARHARGAAKRTDLARAKLYRQRAIKHQPRCAPAPSRGATGPTTPTTNPTYPGAPAPTPLRFNLSGAIGLALGGAPTPTATPAASPAARPAAAQPADAGAPSLRAVQADAVAPSPQTVAAQPADAGTPTLQTVQTDGQLVPAVTSGSAPISHFLIGPDGKVYVAFSTPVNLANTSQYSFAGGCVLAEVDRSSGVPSCVDSSLSMVNWTTGEYHGGSVPIQFDSSGAM